MFSYELYKIVHFTGIFMLFFSLGGMALLYTQDEVEKSARRRWLSLHGAGLFLMLLGGFGMLARLKLPETPSWLWMKIGLWLVLGSLPAAQRKVKVVNQFIVPAMLVLGLMAVYLVLYKPQLW